jgi:hypothetical protein
MPPVSTKPILPTPTPTTTVTAADLAFEREKAAITSYEEGWDRWDGPIYPVGHVHVGCVSLFPFSSVEDIRAGVGKREDKTDGLCVEEDGYVAPRKVEGGKGVEGKALEVSAE